MSSVSSDHVTYCVISHHGIWSSGRYTLIEDDARTFLSLTPGSQITLKITAPLRTVPFFLPFLTP